MESLIYYEIIFSAVLQKVKLRAGWDHMSIQVDIKATSSLINMGLAKKPQTMYVYSMLCKMGAVMKWKKRNIDYFQIVNAQFVFTTIEGNWIVCL